MLSTVFSCSVLNGESTVGPICSKYYKHFDKREDFDMAKPVCVNDFEELARKTLPQYAYDFYASGANEELTLKNNSQAYKR